MNVKDTPPPPPGSPDPEPAVAAVAADPFAHAELQASLSRPHRMLDIVLGERRRLAANLRQGRDLPAVLAVLLACSTAFALPFALVDGVERVGHVALLFLGSVLLCFPSLQVFGSYLGAHLHWSQSLAIALVIPSAAALFTFGFAPIYWFLDYTMAEGDGLGGAATRAVLLVCSLLLALSHINRCLFADDALQALRANWPLWVGWQILLVFLTYRMAVVLGMFS